VHTLSITPPELPASQCLTARTNLYDHDATLLTFHPLQANLHRAESVSTPPTTARRRTCPVFTCVYS
jgi:hypothetical protein